MINALSQRYFLQASDQKDLQDWVEALNRASKITVGHRAPFSCFFAVLSSRPSWNALCCWRAVQGRLCPDSRALPTVTSHFLHCSCSREVMGADPAAGGVCSPALRAMRDGCAAQSTICALCAALHQQRPCAGSVWVLCTRGHPVSF